MQPQLLQVTAINAPNATIAAFFFMNFSPHTVHEASAVYNTYNKCLDMAAEAKLSDLGDLWTGLQIRQAISPMFDATHRLVTLGDVGEGPMDYGELASMNLGRVNPKFLLREGDIILRARGASHKAALVDDPPVDTVAVAPLYVFRLALPTALPSFIVWWINRPETQAFLASTAHGTHVPTVSRKTFADLKIPLPSHAIQAIITESLELLSQERRITEALANKRERQLDALVMELLNMGRP